jgi:hypothetical protein
VASLKSVCVVDFKAGEGGIEHFPARHDDDVKAGFDLMTPEHLAREPLSAISLNRGTQLSCRCYTYARDGATVLDDEQGHESRVNPKTGAVGTLEIRPAANPLGGRQSEPDHVNPRRRQSAACVPLRVASSAQYDRSWSPFAPESRAFSCAAWY